MEVDAVLGASGDPVGAPVPAGDAQGPEGTKAETVAGLGHATTAVGPNVAVRRVHSFRGALSFLGEAVTTRYGGEGKPPRPPVVVLPLPETV